VIDGFIAVVWIVYVVDLFVAAVPGAWTFRGRRGAMRATVDADIQLTGGLALMHLPVPPWEAACVAKGATIPDTARVARVDALMAAAGPVASAASALALVLLAGLPAVRAGWITPKGWLMVGAAAWLTTIGLFVHAYRRLYARWPTVETWFATLLSPVGASRSVYTLTWRALEALHPIEAAAILCDDTELVRVSRRWCYDAPADREAVARLLEPRGLAARLDEPPPEDADRSPRYCPRCGGGYAASATDCADCGVPLLSRSPGDAAGPQRDERIDARGPAGRQVAGSERRRGQRRAGRRKRR
jgi:hypothetical protein